MGGSRRGLPSALECQHECDSRVGVCLPLGLLVEKHVCISGSICACVLG